MSYNPNAYYGYTYSYEGTSRNVEISAGQNKLRYWAKGLDDYVYHPIIDQSRIADPGERGYIGKSYPGASSVIKEAYSLYNKYNSQVAAAEARNAAIKIQNEKIKEKNEYRSRYKGMNNKLTIKPGASDKTMEQPKMTLEVRGVSNLREGLSIKKTKNVYTSGGSGISA